MRNLEVIGPHDRLPPQSQEAEASTLGAMLLGRDAAAQAVEILTPNDFYRDAHRQIFEAAARLFDRGEPIDLISVSNELQSRGLLEATGGVGYLHRLTEQTPYAANVTHYARIVKEKSMMRRLLNAATQIAEKCYTGEEDADTALDEAEKIILSIAQERVERDFVHVKPLLKTAFEEAERKFYAKSAITGVSTGYPDLDNITAGLQPSDLIIIAGRPSMGKTSLALCIAQNAAVNHRVPVGIFSLEMSKEQLAQSMICTEGFIDMQRWRTGYFLQDDWDRMSKAIERLYDAPVYIDDTPAMSALEMRAKARRLKTQYNLGLIVVDYLQLMRGVQRYDSRVQEISEITRSLKSLARELNVPLVACAQLSRAVEQRTDKRPMLSDLRESGQIEADADLVMALYRPSYYKREEGQAEEIDRPGQETLDETEVIILKQRNGPVGTIKLGFLKRYKKFVPLEQHRTR
jgi:replicative DNA helicase